VNCYGTIKDKLLSNHNDQQYTKSTNHILFYVIQDNREKVYPKREHKKCGDTGNDNKENLKTYYVQLPMTTYV
jgi:hypothetical protein